MEATTTKPFPWVCPDCRQKTVWPIQKEYITAAEHDGVRYEITVHNAQVPTCSQCGQAIITSAISEQVSAELRRAAGLLTPERIRARREALGLTRAELAGALRMAEATLMRWEAGLQLQPRAVDLLLRIYFDSAEVRRACATTTFAAAAPIVSTATT
jgi:putative zinc finger/helix-turn-helix YgiT family protein